jgi:hypothetical protein
MNANEPLSCSIIQSSKMCENTRKKKDRQKESKIRTEKSTDTQ